MTTNKKARDVLDRDLGPLTFGSFLRAARTSKDMNQTEMAKFLSVTKSTLCDIEKGRQLVSPALASRIARKCGLSEVVAVETALMDQLRKAKIKMSVRVKSEAA
jgi:DNA-binding XRE family transcriptional regulator